MVLIGLAWIPVIQGRRGLYFYLQSVQGYLAPPIFVVFFLGVFMPSGSTPGAAWRRCSSASCWACSAWPSIRPSPWGWRASKTATPQGSFLWIVNNIYFQYYSLMIFLVCVGRA